MIHQDWNKPMYMSVGLSDEQKGNWQQREEADNPLKRSTAKQADKQISYMKDRQTHRQTNKQTDKQTHKQTHRQIQTDRQTDKKTKQADRQRLTLAFAVVNF